MSKELHRLGIAVLCMVLAVSLLPAAGQREAAAPDDELVLTWMNHDRPEMPIRPDSTTIEEIRRLTGVRIEIEGIPGSDFDQVAQVLLATDDLPDVLGGGNSFNLARDFYDTGVILPISDYWDIMPDMARVFEGVPDARKYFLDGKLYHTMTLRRYYPRYGQLPVIRADILNELGLSAPDSFEELYEVLKAMKQAYPNTFPYTQRGLGSLMAISYALSVPYGLDWDPDIDGGSWIYGTARDEFIGTLEFLNRLYEEELLDPDYAVIPGPEWQERLGGGRSFFFFDNASFSQNINEVVLRSEGVEDAFQVIPTLENSDGRRRNRLYDPHWWTSGHIISSSVDQVERVMEFFNWFYTDQGVEVSNWGIEGVDWYRENDRIRVAEQHIEARMGDADPWRSHMSYMKQWALAQYFDSSNMFDFISDDAEQMYAIIEADDSLDERNPRPPLTGDEIRRVTPIQARLDTLSEEWIDRFIIGDIPLSRFPEFQRLAREAGVAELEEIYNAAEARVRAEW